MKHQKSYSFFCCYCEEPRKRERDNKINTKKRIEIKNQNKKISRIENKTNRLINLKLGLNTYNTTTKREEEKYKKGINKILTNYNTKRKNKWKIRRKRRNRRRFSKRRRKR